MCTVNVSAKDASPAASPTVITPAVDTSIPQSPMAYNGDTSADIQVTPAATDLSSSALSTEPVYTLPGRHSESDSSTVKEPVCSNAHCCTFNTIICPPL